MNRRWLVNKTNKDFLEYLSRKASISTTFAQILINRGLKDIDSIRDFFSPSIENLHDPFLMPDMEKAVERIKSASNRKETILICGDYDVDGITSTALMVSVLRTLGLNAHYHIPDRFTEGYGLSKEGIQKAQSLGAGLIITVDCGISSIEVISEAVSTGIDVIITDHHEPPKKLPQAMAVINPRRIDSEYPFKYLAGVGVAYKLAQALFQNTGHRAQNIELENFLGLVTLGTIADSTPLIGENRILVTYGLKTLNNGLSKPWLFMLKESASVGSRDISPSLLSYTLIPRINAAGRLRDANPVVELFLTEDEAVAKGITSLLEEQNRKRQNIEEAVYKSAIQMINDDGLDSAIVLSSSEWHQGVIGIVASRLVEMFYRPAFLLSMQDGIAKGSARSIPPFHIYNGISECAELLLNYGGHSQAAGLKLYTDNIPAFKEKINYIVKNTLNEEDLRPVLEIDAGVELFEINFNLVRELALLEPFDANKEPLLAAKNVEIIDPRIVGNNHLKMRLKQKALSMDTIGFGMGGLLSKKNDLRFVDVAFVPIINEWNGSKSIQLNLKALRPSL